MKTPIEAVVAKGLGRDDETVNPDAILRLLDRPLSDEDLRQHTRRVASPLEPGEKDVIRLLVFQVGEELMALTAVQVHQVTKATEVRRIPHRSNTIIRGLCNLDGELMLCADLARLLELGDSGGAAKREEQPWMIVLGDEQNRWVVEVDTVKGVMAVARSKFRSPPITVDAAVARYTTSLVPLDQDTVALLDLQRVVSGFQAALR